VKSLPGEERRLFQRLFYLGVVKGLLSAPETMNSWIERYFGSLERVSTQKIVKIINLITFEGALFNKLRADRPIGASDSVYMKDQTIDASSDDPLRHPLQGTPEDTFGRVEGKHCITASNIAKYDGLHGMVIFNEYNPLRFNKEEIVDYIDVGCQWAERAYAADPSARYFFFMWNCLWRAGASLEHGHAQVMLTHDMPYAKIERLRRSALRYQEEYGSNYFDDLYQVHLSLGCALEKEGTRVISHLTPIKDKEIILLAESLDLSMKERIYEVLECYRDKMGVRCFNLALSTLPLGEVEESWEGFPVIARLVDRGNPRGRASDIGTMELYASSVIASDPLEVARLLEESLG
jgi:hypothetical protein